MQWPHYPLDFWSEIDVLMYVTCVLAKEFVRYDRLLAR
jgi:hypothetical protein